jgi:hypothetical protein
VPTCHVHADARGDTVAGPADLEWFRHEFYRSCTARADALFELTEAVFRRAGGVELAARLQPGTATSGGSST